MSTPIPQTVETYLRLVESDKPKACKDQHAFAAYIHRVFETEDLVVDYQQLEKFLSLVKYFPFDRLYPWEECLLTLWDCTYTQDGLPRWPVLFCMLGRGAGKDGFIAYDGFCSVSPYHRIKKYNVDICAFNEAQAMQPVTDLVEVLEQPRQESKLAKFYRHTKEWVRGLKNGGVLTGRTNSPRGRNGLRSGKVIFNECHLYENYGTINVMTAGFGKVPHPRTGIFTSNGHISDGPLDDYLGQSQRILFEGESDHGFLPFVCRLNNEQEVHQEDNWYMANPSLAYKPELLAEIRRQYEDWLAHPERNGDFMAMRMGIRAGFTEISVTDYEKVLQTNRPLPDLRGWSCVVGMDYAELSDWASVNLHFRRGNERYDINRSWICRQSKTLPKVHAPWQDWADKKLVTVVDDVSISPTLLAAYVQDMAKQYNIKMLAMDHYRWTLVTDAFRAIGWDPADKERVKRIRPQDIMQVEPVIQECFDRNYFIWGDTPPLRWGVNNTKRVRSSRGIGSDTGNFYYAKIEAKSRKTDPFMSLVASMCIESVLGTGEPVQAPMKAITW